MKKKFLIFALVIASSICFAVGFSACDLFESSENDGKSTKVSEGLEYTLSDDETYYLVTGIGTCSDTKIVIPDTYNNLPVSIGEKAFYECTQLISVTIPAYAAYIGEEAFYNCTSLTSIYYNAVSLSDSNSANNRIFYCAGQSGDGITLTIGANVTKIPDLLFCPNAFSEGEEYAAKIINVIFEENSICESIGTKSFYRCTSLINLDIPDSITSIGQEAFRYCISLTNVNIGNGVTSIGDQAFRYCTSLTDVTLGNNVAYIGSQAFTYTSIKSITIPASVTSIDDYAFDDCSSLKSIDVDSNNTSYKSIDGNLYSYDGTTLIQYTIGKTETSFTIPDEVTAIHAYAFSGCTSLESLIIPAGVNSIEFRAFFGCSSLTSVLFKNTNGWCRSLYSNGKSWSGISSESLSNTSTAAIYLTDTDKYCNYYWFLGED